MHSSWHVPRLKTEDQPSPHDVLDVVFLQRLPRSTRKGIVEILTKVAVDWASAFDPSGAMSKPRKVRTIPWIRDSCAEPETILETLSIKRDKYRSYILVDSLWEDSTVVAAHWITAEDGASKLDAVRVPISMANVLLTLVDNGQISGFAHALGEAVYMENKIDLYTEGSRKSYESKELPAYEQPSFLPPDLKLHRSKLEIVSLVELSQGQIEALQSDILHNSGKVDTVPSIIIHNWQGPSPSRNKLRQLYDRMNENSAGKDRNSLAWFVDNIIEGSEGSPRVVALTAYVQPGSSHSVIESTVSLFPLRRENVLPLFSECVKSHTLYEEAIKHCDLTEREDIVATHIPIDFDDENGSSCPVFYLYPFNTEQERAIRVALNEASAYDPDKDYSYYGYLFPPNSRTHTIEDLFDLFQKCDPFSPSFDPAYSDVRFKNYPTTFVAVDLNCLDAGTPKVYMADAKYSWFEAPENGATYRTGWLYGTAEADMAWSNFFNLWISNVESFEVFEDHKILYLDDMEEYEEEMRDEEIYS